MTRYLEALHVIRETEVETASRLLPDRGKVLELGGGDGFQARVLSGLGHDVESIDVSPRAPQLFPVQRYDGHTIPFPDATFDAVFSSNVLEHIVQLERTFAELRRVLKPHGVAVHVLPTPVWRFWTTVTHYAEIAKSLRSRVTRARSRRTAQDPPAQSTAPSSNAFLGLFGLTPHGEYGNAVAELYYFSRFRWEREFLANGFDVVSYSSGNLFYTGHLILPDVSVATRRRLSNALGSACHVFVTRAR